MEINNLKATIKFLKRDLSNHIAGKPWKNINDVKDYVWNYLIEKGIANVPPINSDEFNMFINLLTEDLKLFESDEIWNSLKEMGYSKGDIVLTDDFIEAGGDIDDSDEYEEKYDITFVSSEDVEGDAPGEYEYIGEDIDINIPREEYSKFIRLMNIIKQSKYVDEYEIPTFKELRDLYIKLRNAMATILYEDLINNLGIGNMDIYVKSYLSESAPISIVKKALHKLKIPVYDYPYWINYVADKIKKEFIEIAEYNIANYKNRI